MGIPDECVRQKSLTRSATGTSRPPMDPPTLPPAPRRPGAKRAVSVTPTFQKPSSSRKRSRPDASVAQSEPHSRLLPQHHSTSQEPIPVAQTLESGPLGLQATLYSIPEADDSDMVDGGDPSEVFSFTAPQEGAKEFLSALGDGVMLSDPEDESEDYEQDIAAISSTSNADLSSESSGTDDAFLQSSLPPPPPATKKKVRSTSMSREGTSTQARTAQSTYDPQACRKYRFRLTIVLLC